VVYALKPPAVGSGLFGEILAGDSPDEYCRGNVRIVYIPCRENTPGIDTMEPIVSGFLNFQNVEFVIDRRFNGVSLPDSLYSDYISGLDINRLSDSSSLSPITVLIGGLSVTIPATDLVSGRYDFNRNVIPGTVGLDVFKSASNRVVLGAPFLRQVLTVLDVPGTRVGICTI
jgi:hypothetical protein